MCWKHGEGFEKSLHHVIINYEFESELESKIFWQKALAKKTHSQTEKYH